MQTPVTSSRTVDPAAARLFQTLETFRDVFPNIGKLVLGLALGLGGPAAARGADLEFTNTRAICSAYITNLMAQYAIPGVTVALVESQRVVWAAGFGWADLASQRPVTTNTVMMIGSVSKFITAIMAEQLVDEGALDLDTCVDHYIPEFTLRGRFPGEPEAWTARRMLNHHAGLPGDLYNGAFGITQYWPGYIAWLIDYLQDDYPLYQPARIASYCNSGFNIVGEIVTRHDGVDFSAAAETRIFGPLDMPYSSFLPDKPLVAANLATAYQGGGAPAPFMIGNMAATGGACSRPLDMAQLIMMILGGGQFRGSNVLTQARLDEMARPANAPMDRDNYFIPGLGLDSVADPVMSYAGATWAKSGDTGTSTAFLEILPDRQLGVFVNFNASHYSCMAVGRTMLQNALRERDGLEPPPIPALPETPETQWPYAELQAIEGYYNTGTGVDRFIAETNGTLSCIRDAQNNTAVTAVYQPHTNGRFYPAGQTNLQFAFTNIAGHALILSYGTDGGLRDQAIYGGYAEKISASRCILAPISAAWSNRAGIAWVADNMYYDDWIYGAGTLPAQAILEGNGILALAGTAVLEPVNDRLAMVGGLLTRADSCVRIETNAAGREFLWFGGYRFQRYNDLPALTNAVAAAGVAAAHTNALFTYEPAAAGQSVVFLLSTNAAAAVVRVFNDEFRCVATGTGQVEYAFAASDPVVVSVSAPDPVRFQIKAVDVTETRAAMQRTLVQFPFIPGFGVAVQEPGFPAIVLAEGYARISPPSTNGSVLLAGHERFHIASISKTYTAAAIFLLQQRGRLNIADCITNYVAELDVPRGRDITVEQLLEHRSGLPDANNTIWIDDKMEADPLLEFTVEEIVDVAAYMYPDLMFEPGTAYHYTDTGYNILARMVENVSGTNYQAFVRDHILAPLGLADTVVPYNSQATVPAPAVNTYMLLHGAFQDRSVWCPSAEFGCGSIEATLQDLLDMTHGFFLATNLLTAATHAQMMDRISPTGQDYYGRGCSLMNGLGWGHDGIMWGALSTAHVDTNTGVRVSAVLNGQYDDDRLPASLYTLRSAGALLKNAMGYAAGTLGRQPPTIRPELWPTRQGHDFRFQLSACNFPTHWVITGLPAGMGYDPAFGQITGVTYAIGIHSLTVTAQNAYGTATNVISWEVETGYTNTIACVSAWIANQMATAGIPGAAIALVDGQEIVWAQGFGCADVEAQQPVTTNTVFHIGSVSKTFTAAAALQYAEKGWLDIEAPFTNYTPGVGWKARNPGARSITTRDLLAHHSGLPGDLLRGAFLTQPLGLGYGNVTNDLAQTYPIFEPGTIASYCNAGFVLLEGIIEEAAERASGDRHPFDQVVNDNIFDLLGMRATSYKFDKPAISNNLAPSYIGGQRVPHEYVEIYGTGSMYSRPTDMAKFISALFAVPSPVIATQTLAAMTAGQATNSLYDPFTTDNMGLGWDQVGDPQLNYAGRNYWKNGATVTYSANLAILADHELGVAVVANSTGELADPAAILALQHALLDKTGITWPTNPAVFPTNIAPVTAEQLAALTGVYAGSTAFDLVRADTHTLTLTYQMDVPHNGRALSNLVCRTDGWFMADAAPTVALAFTNLHGRDVVLYRQASPATVSQHVLSDRFQPPPVPAAWSNRVGNTWMLRNLPAYDFLRAIGVPPDLHLRQTNGVLYVETGGYVVSRAVAPVSDTLAWIPGLNNRGDSALQAETIGGQEHIRYAGYLFGPAPEIVMSATTITGAINQPGFAAWYQVAVDTNQVVGPYTLAFANTPATFIVRVYGADNATLLAEGTAAAPLTFTTAQSPYYICILPATTGAQTGAFAMTLQFRTRSGGVPAAISILLLE